jgi:hypothetical protein
MIEKAVDDMPPLKLLSYADDLQVFVNHMTGWKVLLHILDLYGKASNAKVNLSKTIVISMSGKTHIEWSEILQRESMKWHDKTDQRPIVQLGYLHLVQPTTVTSISRPTGDQNSTTYQHPERSKPIDARIQHSN